MNVTDRWLLEQMQQMAASMAASLPQIGQSGAQPPKTGNGDSFQDMMDKARLQQTQASGQDGPSEGKEPVQGEPSVQGGEQPQKAESAPWQPPQTQEKQIKVSLDVGAAVLVAAGFARVEEVCDDGSVLLTVDTRQMDGVLVCRTAEADGPLPQVTLRTGEGQEITVTPAQLQAVFSRCGLPAEAENENSASPVAYADEAGQQAGGDVRSAWKLLYRDGEYAPADSQGDTPELADVDFIPVKADRADGQEDGAADWSAELMARSQPLFRDVKAAPVKVGENFRLDTREPGMDDRLADMIRYADRQDLRQVEIRLSPENLGALTIRLTQGVDGTLQVVLHTANAKAANLLSRHMDGLNQALQGYGQDQQVRVEVRHSEDSRQEQRQFQQADPNGHNRQQQQQQHRQENEHSGDFLHKLRLGLFSLEDGL